MYLFIYFHLLIQTLIFSVPVLILTTCNAEKFHSMKITVCKCKVRLFFSLNFIIFYISSRLMYSASAITRSSLVLLL